MKNIQRVGGSHHPPSEGCTSPPLPRGGGGWGLMGMRCPMRLLSAFLMFTLLVACVATNRPTDAKSDILIEALVNGSAEVPDPVLERVREFEKNGIVKDVRVMESSPVQIHLKATKEVIEVLNSIPRSAGSNREVCNLRSNANRRPGRVPNTNSVSHEECAK